MLKTILCKLFKLPIIKETDTHQVIIYYNKKKLVVFSYGIIDNEE